jgi:hypothetical protein
MSAQVATLYGAYMSVFAAATTLPRSKMSGWRPVPASCFAVLISSWLFASGWSDWTLIPYFVWKSVIIWP